MALLQVEQMTHFFGGLRAVHDFNPLDCSQGYFAVQGRKILGHIGCNRNAVV